MFICSSEYQQSSTDSFPAFLARETRLSVHRDHMGAILYIGIKYAAYTLWCLLGLRLFQPSRSSRVAIAMGFGVLRLLMGLCFGVGIWLIASLVYTALSHAPFSSVLTYLLAYIPIRWVEWSIMLVLISASCRSPSGFFLGCAKSDRLWRAGGIILSCLADIPMIITLGGILPVGRFMC